MAAPAWRQDEHVPAVVTLRPLASGLPFGFFGLVAAATITGAQALNYIPDSASKAVGLLLLPTVLLQLVAGVYAVLSRDGVAATLMLTFSGVWLGTALLFITDPVDGHLVLGVWYLALAPVIIGLLTTATSKLALTVVPSTGLPTFVVTAVWLIEGGRGLADASGILSFVLAAAGLYAGVALLLEDVRSRAVLPTARRGTSRQAFTDGFSSQLEGVEREAGVRRFL